MTTAPMLLLADGISPHTNLSWFGCDAQSRVPRIIPQYGQQEPLVSTVDAPNSAITVTDRSFRMEFQSVVTQLAHSRHSTLSTKVLTF